MVLQMDELQAVLLDIALVIEKVESMDVPWDKLTVSLKDELLVVYSVETKVAMKVVMKAGRTADEKDASMAELKGYCSVVQMVDWMVDQMAVYSAV